MCTELSPRGDAGFTLLEVLVAFAIAALALAALTGAGLTGLGAAKLSDRYQEALARARSHLAAIGPNPQPSDRQGDEGDGYHWHVRIVQLAAAPVLLPGEAPGLGHDAGQAVLYHVSVAISWGALPGRTLRLNAERVAVQPQGAGGP